MVNEKRLIDANALTERIKERLKNSMIVGWLCGIVDDAPTVDAVEVVRCKDCYYYGEKYPGRGYCKYFDTLRIDNDFCSSGQRRDNDT